MPSISNTIVVAKKKRFSHFLTRPKRVVYSDSGLAVYVSSELCIGTWRLVLVLDPIPAMPTIECGWPHHWHRVGWITGRSGMLVTYRTQATPTDRDRPAGRTHACTHNLGHDFSFFLPKATIVEKNKDRRRRTFIAGGKQR